MAETFTNNLKLSKHDTGDLNWGESANANADLIDNHAQLKNLRPPRTLLASLGSGAVGGNLSGSTAYFYKVTAFNALGETTENKIPSILEAQVTQAASPLPIILSWETVPGASGYRIYKSILSGSEELLVEVTGESSAVYTDDGNTAVQTGVNVPALNTALLSVSGIRKLGEANPLRGDVSLEAGSNITLTQDGVNGKITIDAAGGGVSSLREEGQGSGLTGDVNLRAGTNITLTQDGPGNAIEIAAAGGGGGQSPFTAVVEAPTGVAATDTTNISNAIASVPASGGTVVLKEGTYVVNQISLNKPGLKLIGSGNGFSEDGSDVSGTKIQANNAANPLLQVSVSDVTIEEVTFDGAAVASNQPVMQVGTGSPIRFISVRNCSFLNFKSDSPAAVSILGTYNFTAYNCYFLMKDAAAQTAAGKVPAAIKIESAIRIRVERCRFRNSYLTSSAGTINSKCISANDTYDSMFASNFADTLGNSGSVTFGFFEAVTTNSVGSFLFRDNLLNDLHYFIKMSVSSSISSALGNYFKPKSGATDPAIDLVSGNIRWVIAGNSLGGKAINLQAGANNNIITGNYAAITDAGTGNLASNNSSA